MKCLLGARIQKLKQNLYSIMHLKTYSAKIHAIPKPGPQRKSPLFLGLFSKPHTI